jgi:response regulator RpfG family c-di-GMP phosphodiesterase
MIKIVNKVVSPLIKHPVLCALCIWVLFQAIRLLAFKLSGASYLGDQAGHFHRAPLSTVLLLLSEFLVPLVFLYASKRVFMITSRNLSVRIHEGLNQVKQTQNVSVMGFTRLAEARDPDTGDHILRIAHYSRMIAEELAHQGKYEKYITPSYVEEIYISAPLHDIGKVGIKDEILLKEGRLTDEEFEIMKMHTIIGGNIIAELERKLNFRTFFTLGKEIAYHHHQKYNGRGYPNIFKDDIMLVEEGVGRPLVGEDIPLSARICALADVYDALVSKRCYKRAFSHETACDIIQAEKGEHFDPVIVDVFLENHGKFKEIRKRYGR